MKQRLYLDEAAAAPVLKTAWRAFVRAQKAWGNPSAPHAEGASARTILETARTDIARLVGTKSDAILFTSGATEANALALQGYIDARLEEGITPHCMHVLYLSYAHASVTETMKYFETKGIRTEAITLSDGAIDLPALRKQITTDTVLISLEAIASETGMSVRTRDVRRMLDDIRKEGGTRIVLHVDASQMPYVESIDRMRLGADLLTLDAQKIGGVRGIGVLVRPPAIPLVSRVYGGGQEQGLRSGTETPALAAAFSAALYEAQKMRDEFVRRAKYMRERLTAYITAEISNIQVNEGKENAPHILNISVCGRDTDYLVALLDVAGYAVSTRSACETDVHIGKNQAIGSRSVFALTKDKTRSTTTLRISWGPSTSVGGLMRFAQQLKKDVEFLDQNRS